VELRVRQFENKLKINIFSRIKFIYFWIKIVPKLVFKERFNYLLDELAKISRIKSDPFPFFGILIMVVEE